MAFTPEQIAKIRQKEASLSDAHKRDPLTNYFEGYFFVTLNTRDEAPILSTVEGHVGAIGNDAPHCRYTDLGKSVIEVWNRNPTFYPDVEVLACEAMPEHFHGLLYLRPGNKRHLGRVINGFMAGCSHAYWDKLGIDWRSMTYIKGARAPEWQDADHTRSLRGPALFTRGYNDVEPITPAQVQIKLDYIHSQAERRLIKQQGYDRFTIFRHQRSTNWNKQAVLTSLSHDRYFAHNKQALNEAFNQLLPRLNHNTTSDTCSQNSNSQNSLFPDSLLLDYLGNKALMASDKKLPLICHRADVARFEEQKNAVLSAARNGYIIVSAFISPKEREIRDQLMTELLPFIEIMDNGFADRYKPAGKAFYACAENRMVQISPWTYLYQKDAQVTRAQCLAMNHLARIISQREDDWWKTPLT